MSNDVTKLVGPAVDGLDKMTRVLSALDGARPVLAALQNQAQIVNELDRQIADRREQIVKLDADLNEAAELVAGEG